jgi:hypothetical protein
MRTTLAYTSARIVLFLVTLVLLDLAGARGLLLIALALLISGLLSYLLLSRQRDVMAGALSSRLGARTRSGGFRARLAEGARAEDTDDEQAAPGPDNQPAAPSAPAPDHQ